MSTGDGYVCTYGELSLSVIAESNAFINIRGKARLLFQLHQFVGDPTSRSVIVELFSNEQENFLYKVLLMMWLIPYIDMLC